MRVKRERGQFRSKYRTSDGKKLCVGASITVYIQFTNNNNNTCMVTEKKSKWKLKQRVRKKNANEYEQQQMINISNV